MMNGVAIVTGATGGIGKSIAAELAAAGWRVYGTSRNAQAAAPVPGVTFVDLDLASETSISACVAQVLLDAGKIDAVVSNAGMLGPAGALEELSPEQARAIFETNFFGVFTLTNAVLPRMIEAGGGSLIYISSTGGRVAAIPFFSIYTASKHALEAYAEGLRRETAPFGVRVSLIEPGYTQTGMMETLEQPQFPNPRYDSVREPLLALERFGLRHGTPPRQVALAVRRALENPHPRLHYPVGSDSAWIIALDRLLPHALFERLLHWMFFTWRPEPPIPTIPEQNDLGIRRILFHGPTRDRVIRAGWVAVAAGLLAGAAGVFFKKRRS